MIMIRTTISGCARSSLIKSYRITSLGILVGIFPIGCSFRMTYIVVAAIKQIVRIVRKFIFANRLAQVNIISSQ